jgi:hypothetical protein
VIRWGVRALALVAFAGCSIGSLTIEGKDCPCPSGYTCVLNRCTQQSGGDAAIGDGRVDAPSSTLFDDEFDDGVIAPVWDLDSGSWTEKQGMFYETGNGGTTIWVKGFETATDYNVVVAASAQGNTPVIDDAIETAVRVTNDVNHTHYQCSWEPGDKTLRLFDVPRTHTNDLDSLPSTLTLDPFRTYVIHTDVTGKTIHCYVEGVPTANLTLQLTDAQLNAGLGMGTFGLATYNQSAAFDYIRVTH